MSLSFTVFKCFDKQQFSASYLTVKKDRFDKQIFPIQENCYYSLVGALCVTVSEKLTGFELEYSACSDVQVKQLAHRLMSLNLQILCESWCIEVSQCYFIQNVVTGVFSN